MSFDLCWTFIRAKVPRRGSALVKFIIYSAVAWGSSAAFTLGIIMADQFMEDHEDDTVLVVKPNVGKLKCFLQDDSQGIFLHLPCMILMMMNTLFFLITTTSLYRSNINTQRARQARQTSRINTHFKSSRINQDAKDQLVSTYVLNKWINQSHHISGSVYQAVHSDGYLADI